MKKIMMLVVAVAVVTAVPQLRSRLSAHALPALERIGPVGRFAIEPARRHAARARCVHALRLLANDYNTGVQWPDPRDFHVWLEKRTGKGSSLDPWGNRYWLKQGRSTVTVGSSGPDGRRDTGDDVRQTVPF